MRYLGFKGVQFCPALMPSSFLQGQAKERFLTEEEIRKDDPLPLYKSFWEIASENWWIPATIATLAAIALAGWWLVRKLNREETEVEMITPLRDPFDEAIESLAKLETRRERMEAKPFVFQLSEILRIYVERQFSVPAMEQTGEEFLREIAEHKFFVKRYDDLLRNFIDRSEVVKYSKQGMDGEGLRLLHQSAQHFVEDSHARLLEERSRTSPEEVAA